MDYFQAIFRGHLARKTVGSALQETRDRLAIAKNNAKPEITIGFRSNRLVENLLSDRISVSMLTACLTELSNIVQREVHTERSKKYTIKKSFLSVNLICV